MLAHELTHIRNRDTQLMVIAVIFAGIFAFFGDLLIRGWDFPYGWAPRSKEPGPWGSRGTSGSSSGGEQRLGAAAAGAAVTAAAAP